ncbi:MAG TPA: MBOAT family O-acyltransferase [Bryobacteraceae bacterium]|nr:MBOAT family O-acyltransferase [Bryobacteraceae bacterium]
MNYLSVQFALFLTAAVLGYYLVPRRARPLWLLLASYGFYILSNPLAAAGIFTATVFTFWMGRLVESRQKRELGRNLGCGAMALTVTVLLAYLGFYKIAPLFGPVFAGNSSGLERMAAAATQNVIIPLGISYYSFKLISYVVDVYWRKIPAERNFIAFAAYVAFFPQIVAGPIQRAGDFLEQVHNLNPSIALARSGLQRLLLGCFKKVVVADNLALIVGMAYPDSFSPHLSTLAAFYIFPLQLFADFSALTDIAIGVGRLFGVDGPENFNEPYLATSISQYWRRWHMTLTLWLTDYVFMPLRMATRAAGNWGLAFSLMVNMLLIGLWHSVSWTFAVFGLLHGVFLVVDALSAKTRSRFFKTHPQWDRAANCFGPVLTFHLAALAMVFVRAATMPEAFDFLSRLNAPGFQASGILEQDTLRGLVGLAVWFLWSAIEKWQWTIPARVPVWGRWAFYYLVIASIVHYGHNAEGFIYFKF